MTDVSDLDLPYVSLGPSSDEARASRRELADGGHWLVRTDLGLMAVGYDDVQAILRDRRWHSALGELSRRPDDSEFERWRAERQPTVLHLEGPDHDRLRRLLIPALTPNAVERLRPRIGRIFTDLLDRVLIGEDVDRDPVCDVAAELCEPYPVSVIFELLGAPIEMAGDFIELVRATGASRRDPETSVDVIMADTAAFDRFAAELIDATPQRGLLGDLKQAERDRRLSRAELVSLTQTLLAAGTESTSGQLACAALLLARFDDQYQLLQARPELAAGAVEEVMRYLGAVRGSARIASESIDHRGVRFPPGTMVLLGFTAANRDRTRFDQPDRFDITRTPDPPHLTFGHGIHYCVGAALARVELQEALVALTDRVSRIELAGEIRWRPQTADFWGPAVLPAVLHRQRDRN